MRVLLPIIVISALTVIKRGRIYERADYLDRRTYKLDE